MPDKRIQVMLYSVGFDLDQKLDNRISDLDGKLTLSTLSIFNGLFWFDSSIRKCIYQSTLFCVFKKICSNISNSTDPGL